MPRDHGHGGDARFAAAAPTIAGSGARADLDRVRCLSRHLRRRSGRVLAAGMRLRAGPGNDHAGSEPALVHRRCAWPDVRRSRVRAARSTRPASPPPVRRRLRAIAIRAGRSGARRKAIRATRPIAISIATSASIFPSEYLRPGTTPPGARKFTGLEISPNHGSRSGEKELYDPALAESAAEAHAAHFLEVRRQQMNELRALDFDPIVVAPFDAELFGHWWFEGPRFSGVVHSQGRSRASGSSADEQRRLRSARIFNSPRRPNFWPIIRRNKRSRPRPRAGAKTAISECGSTRAIPGFIRISIPPLGA